MICRLILLLLIVPASVNATGGWPFKAKINRYNANGLRDGSWIYYWDDAQKKPMNKLRFKNGREHGLNRYYNENGKKWLKFRAFKDGRMNVTYYDDNGRREKKGKALMIYDAAELRYCWHGKWKYYENGRFVREAVYNMGNETPVLRKQRRR